MKYTRFVKTFIILSILVLFAGGGTSYGQNHIRDLDALRNSMTAVSGKLSDMIKAAQNNEMRTLERVYEINTYALTTIEAYFKMIRVAVSSDGRINQQIIAVFNTWLEFITKYCEKDLSYLDEALSQMTNPEILKVLRTTKANIKSLDRIAARAMDENENLLKRP